MPQRLTNHSPLQFGLLCSRKCQLKRTKMSWCPGQMMTLTMLIWSRWKQKVPRETTIPSQAKVRCVLWSVLIVLLLTISVHCKRDRWGEWRKSSTEEIWLVLYHLETDAKIKEKLFGNLSLDSVNFGITISPSANLNWLTFFISIP